MLVVLSPHLDDAVLSASASLLDAPGTRVVTCFAGAPPPGTPPTGWEKRCGARDAHEHVLARREEDRRALTALGAEPRWADLLEDGHRTGTLTPDELAEHLREHIPEGSTVLAPLAVGGHPDHLLVHRAAARLDGQGYAGQLLLYADLPYASTGGWPDWVLPRHRRLARRVARLAGRQGRPTGALADACERSDVRLGRLDATVHVLRGRRWEAKREAVQAYASQVRALHLDERSVLGPLRREVQLALPAGAGARP